MEKSDAQLKALKTMGDERLQTLRMLKSDIQYKQIELGYELSNDEIIAEAGASSLKDIGEVMKVLMPRVRGRADGKEVNIAVRAKLAK